MYNTDMPFLVDGHNLIPKIPGLSLRQLDDETELTRLLAEYCRKRRQKVEVFYDGAPPGHAARQQFALLTAHFIRKGQTADEAIRLRLVHLGKEARNWQVVSSDRRVQTEAKALGARVLNADQFAADVLDALRAPEPGERGEQPLSDAEVQEWMEMFRSKKKPGK